jgi:DNA-binding transcriptional regulator YiaG
MTPTEFRAALADLGLSQSKAARRWPVTLRTVQTWATRGPVSALGEMLVERERKQREERTG